MARRFSSHFGAVRTLALATLVVLIACAGDAPRPDPSGAGAIQAGNADPRWVLAWSDEFDGPSGAGVDTSKWRHDLGDGCTLGICGWGNQEKQYYTDSRDNIALDGRGNLRIVARRATSRIGCYYGPCRYTSAKITTRGRMTAAPGRVEARIKVPAGQGLWPAFWLLGAGYPATGWPDCGELDVMEFRGSTLSTTSSAVHGPGYSGQTPFTHAHTLAGGTFVTDFHVFAVEWDAVSASFSIDGTVHYTVTAREIERRGRSVLGNSYFLILNLAVGGHFDGDPKSDAILPAAMTVDWVRVYAPREPPRPPAAPDSAAPPDSVLPADSASTTPVSA